MKKFVELRKNIYDEGKWPEDFVKSILILLKKNAVRCEEFRTINLISHA